jgi:hypothetical protein
MTLGNGGGEFEWGAEAAVSNCESQVEESDSGLVVFRFFSVGL